MIPQELRRPGYYAASHWLVGSVSVVLIFLLSLWLLSALQRTEEVVERMIVEQTVQNIRTGLKIAMAEAVIAQREGEIAGWAGDNPVRWLAAPPNAYAGECVLGVEAKEGVWCFERVSGDLLYRPRHANGLRSSVDGKELSALRWRVATAEKGRGAESVAWLSVVNVTPYIWVIK